MQTTLALHTPLGITAGIVLILMDLRTILVSTRATHGATCRDATCGDLRWLGHDAAGSRPRRPHSSVIGLVTEVQEFGTSTGPPAPCAASA
jgi:hypothetical protein